ncbi:MAG: methyltransferase domain-containing protein [Alphaproteobacteria bacterium]|nr:methyltransferase domain-containing protein [Alphaproteobacteria bacterium]
MVGRFQTVNVDARVLPGRPADYIGTPVGQPEFIALMENPDVIVAVMNDPAPLPTTEAREGYYGPNHLEFWLSGLRDTRKVMEASGLFRDSAPIILDFGGASGRVVRHMAREMPNAQIYLCDINREHIALVKATLGDRVTAFPIVSAGAHLPFRDNFLEIVTAFSVFTHFWDDDLTWLLEMQRTLKPGGLAYVTIHDSESWRRIPNLFLRDLCFSNEDFRLYHEAHPELTERVVHFYNEADDYNCNTFHPESYIHGTWGKLFDVLSITPAAHDHQAAVLMRKR